MLTSHAMNVLAGWQFAHWHVSCRRPSNARLILSRLVAAHLPFSVDFHLASTAEQIFERDDESDYSVGLLICS